MSKTLTVRAYPKINLALDVLRKAPSGYHEIQTVFHELAEPFDEIILEEAPAGILEVDSDNPALPRDATNTALKAAHLLREATGVKKGIRIFIKKKIPVAGGLGGGSSDAVAGLKGLIQLWGIPCCKVSFPRKRESTSVIHEPTCLLHKLAIQISMDCAFFIDGGTALGTHFGEVLTPLPSPPENLHFKIIDTGVKTSTRSAYASLDLSSCGKNLGETTALIEGLREGNAEKILKNIHNDFEQENGGRIMLCGSGSCYFTLTMNLETTTFPPLTNSPKIR